MLPILRFPLIGAKQRRRLGYSVEKHEETLSSSDCVVLLLSETVLVLVLVIDYLGDRSPAAFLVPPAP